MVKKLLKYEFSSLAKSVLPMEIILLGMAVLTRFLQFFETDSTTFNSFMISSVVMLIVSMIVCIVMTFVVCIVRFYKNMYTSEGYLTLTLPVTQRQHIWAKLISSVCAFVISIITVIVASMIATAGDLLCEIIKAAVYLAKKAITVLHAEFYLYALEAAVLVITMIAFSYLLSYFCLTLGQMAKKNRILASFGVFFAYYIISQILATVLIIIYLSVSDAPFIREIITWFLSNIHISVHIMLCGFTVYYALLSVLFFTVSGHIMKNKLNLE